MAVSRKDSRGYALYKNEFERKNKKGYEYRWWDPYTGKHRSISAPTLKELRKREQEVLRDRIDGIKSDSDITLNDYYRIWKNLKTGLKDDTRENYMYMYERFVKDSLGKKPLCKLKYSDVVSFYTQLVQKRQLSVSTLDTLHTVIHPVLDMAVNDDVIRRNVSDGALKDLKAEDKKKAREEEANGLKPKSYTLDEQARILSVISGTRWEPVFKFLLYTGVRIGELGGLSWADIDYANSCIHIRKTLVYYDHRSKKQGCRYNINTTKTATSFRDLPLNDELREILRLQKEVGLPCEMTVDGFSHFIFGNKEGRCVNQSNINSALRRITKEANADPKAPLLLSSGTCHKFRKTYATNMVRAGVDMPSLMALLGHTDSSITMKYYTEAQLDMKLEADRKMHEKLAAERADGADRNADGTHAAP